MRVDRTLRQSRVGDEGMNQARARPFAGARSVGLDARRQEFASRNLDFSKWPQPLKVFGDHTGKDIFFLANHDQQTPQGHAEESAHSLKSEGGG
jgi:hypothetical protein